MPADTRRAVILRRIEAVDGPARVDVVLDVRAGFGRSRMTDLSRAGGRWTGRSGAIRFRWSGAARARPGADGLALTLSLPAGGHHDLVLELSDRPLDAEPPGADEAWAATEETWSSAVPDCKDLIGERDARHAYAVLSGLTARSGAMVAAVTTSLPERMEGGRNYATGTRGSAISATRGSRSPPTAPTPCSTEPSGSSPSGSWPTARTSCRPTPWPGSAFPANAGSG
jgi:alpha,alpha-trehalase